MSFKVVSESEFNRMRDALDDAIDAKGTGKPLPKGLALESPDSDVIGAQPNLIAHSEGNYLVLDSQGFVEAFDTLAHAKRYTRDGSMAGNVEL